MSAFSFAATGERRQRGDAPARQSQPALPRAAARQVALLRRAVDAAWAKCRKARSLRELAACVDVQPYPVNEIMRAQLLNELAQMGVAATWRDVREGRAAFEAALAGLSAARPGRP
ncbi:MAG: hypothetical protein RQ839_10635 [Thermoproteus sp.]|nr:hypothetical protein [Thermoproteus sp.]MDT7882982.1 hypothetical protein [Thermoproteus sp.]